MNKIYLFSISFIVLLMACCTFTACENKSFISVDYTNDIVGTWSYLEPGKAEALVISADGSVVSTGIEDGEYWEDVIGSVEVVNNKITMIFEDQDRYTGRFDLVPGEVLSFVNDNDGQRYTYHYCANDLSDEIVGMWVCNNGPLSEEDDIAIQTFDKNGQAIFTGMTQVEGEFILNGIGTYKVVGNLLIQKMPEERVAEGESPYVVTKMTYAPKATAMGDVMVQKEYTLTGGHLLEATTSWLRVKKYLELPGTKYDYSATYVTNVQGKDEEITLLGYNFNIAKMDGSTLDKILKYLLFHIEFPSANTIKYQYHYNGQNHVFEAPIKVEGNKMTIDMTAINPIYRDIELYVFQDAYNTQMHMYMPTYAFINYFANMEIATLLHTNKLNTTDTSAIEAIFQKMADHVQTINVSFVLKAAK